MNEELLESLPTQKDLSTLADDLIAEINSNIAGLEESVNSTIEYLTEEIEELEKGGTI